MSTAAGGETQTTRVAGADSAVVHFRVDYKQLMEHPGGEAIHSDEVSVGGQLWRIDCYPGGTREHHAWSFRWDRHHRLVSIFLRRLTRSPSSAGAVNAIFEPFLLGKDGRPSRNITKSAAVYEHQETSDIGAYAFGADDLGYPEFVERTCLRGYEIDGYVTFLCTIVVVNELGPIPVPASDLGDRLGTLLEDDDEAADVSFIVGRETFHAHRALLAARSPVFKAQLFGSMLEAKTPSSITLHEISSLTFKAMLRFIYTDEWPRDNVDELVAGDSQPSSIDMFQDLLAAADRYALDRLKLMCSRKLWDNVTVDNVAAILVCAETYSCPELKKICIDFCMVEENFKQVASNDTYALLELRFPSIAAEIRENTRTSKLK